MVAPGTGAPPGAAPAAPSQVAAGEPTRHGDRAPGGWADVMHVCDHAWHCWFSLRGAKGAPAEEMITKGQHTALPQQAPARRRWVL